ncbi:MAG: hypothetical protein KGL39_41570 [Patescibacteria group bacterium]|nr:hypothetical protein [Patescibacteria group bacterium]
MLTYLIALAAYLFVGYAISTADKDQQLSRVEVAALILFWPLALLTVVIVRWLR